MSFCPVPHTARDQAWLLIGAGLGASLATLALRIRARKPEPPVVQSSPHGLLTFAFDVKGQTGAIPRVGLGTATLNGDECVAAVRHAIRCGYRHIDTALQYDNQEAVGRAIKEAIAAGDVTREELWVTSKVGVYPEAADGTNCKVHIKFHECNRKGRASTVAAVDLCLEKLQLDYVDLMLIHNPATDLDEYEASGCCHFFELSGNTPAARSISAEERALIFERRLARVRVDRAAATAARAATWAALEEAQRTGKARFIGVSNYSPALVAEMETYANVMPAVDQLELHPRFASPALQAQAQALGFVLTGYGSGNSVRIEESAAVAAVARRVGATPLSIVLRWTLAKRVCVIPRSANPAHIAENLAAAAPAAALGAHDVAALDALDEDYPYYWSPRPNLKFADASSS